jgi:hypothetical protein
MPIKIPIPKTADYTSPRIKELCKKLVPRTGAMYLDVEPLDDSIINECFPNVANVIKKRGGTMQCGWQILETFPDVMAEAEFHAVWVDNNKKYHDITPKLFPYITQILFLPDASRKYEGKQIDNIRIPLKDDPLILNFIKSAEAFFEATNRGDLANYHGELVLTPEMKYLKKRKEQLELEMIEKFYSF